MQESAWLRSALRRMAELARVDPEVRAVRVTAADVAAVRDGKRFAIELVAAACARFATRTAFVHRGVAIGYGALWERVRAAGSGLARMGAGSERVLVCGPAGIDWVVADLACLYAGAVSVPVPATADADELARIVAQTAPRGALGAAVPGVAMLELARLEASGREPVAWAEPADDAVFSIVLTSGSTGALKGVVLPERRWAATLRDAVQTIPMPTITLGYLPPSHMAGRIALYATLMAGGVTHFISGDDMSTLFDDLRAVRPTSLTLVPRVSGLFYQHYQRELARRGEHDAAAIMTEMREQLVGGRLCFATTGAAPTAPEVIAFLERCFELHVVDTYGSTELGRVTVDGRVQPGVAYKLVDVPELGYTRADQPYPRGELAVKSERGTPGYHDDPDATARLRDPEGYLLSGDIVEERAPGHLVWIDRKQAVVRLANGESVNTTRLEDLFATSPHLAQVCLHASALRSYVVAVIATAASDAVVRDELDRVAAEARLRAHEIPRAFIRAREPFSAANGLLTETGKPRRARILAAYAAELDALYASIEARQTAALAAAGSIGDRVRDAIALVLGRERGEIADATTFARLGGDSLSAVRLVALVAEHCAVDVPASAVLDPTATVAALVARVERGGAPAVQGGEWVHAHQLGVAGFLPAALVAARPAPAGAPRVVLVTGATGFLGRALVPALRARVDKVVCLVRSRDITIDGVTTVHGDLLGLARFRELADEVDAIVHAGALVNHALAYPHLVEPNVLGTAEVIRLALTGRAKAIHFVSTTGIAGGVRRRVLESERAAALWSRRPVRSTGYAAGYVTSKWAAETLLCDAHDRCGIPVTITRCGMLLPDRTQPAYNAGDAFARLVYGMARTGLGPRSFYSGERRRYDGLPVDVVAEFVAALVAHPAAGLAMFHATDPESAFSLDAVVDAMAVERLPYERWYGRFRDALAALPEADRRRTPWPIIARWEHALADRDAVELDASRFAAALRELTGHGPPALDGAYIAHCIRSICGGAA